VYGLELGCSVQGQGHNARLPAQLVHPVSKNLASSILKDFPMWDSLLNKEKWAI